MVDLTTVTEISVLKNLVSQNVISFNDIVCHLYSITPQTNRQFLIKFSIWGYFGFFFCGRVFKKTSNFRISWHKIKTKTFDLKKNNNFIIIYLSYFYDKVLVAIILFKYFKIGARDCNQNWVRCKDLLYRPMWHTLSWRHHASLNPKPALVRLLWKCAESRNPWIIIILYKEVFRTLIHSPPKRIFNVCCF